MESKTVREWGRFLLDWERKKKTRRDDVCIFQAEGTASVYQKMDTEDSYSEVGQERAGGREDAAAGSSDHIKTAKYN